MKICLYKFCNKDISNKRLNALYCNIYCLDRDRKYKIFKDGIRWAKIGTNSSYEAMKTLYELFKNKN